MSTFALRRPRARRRLSCSNSPAFSGAMSTVAKAAMSAALSALLLTGCGDSQPPASPSAAKPEATPAAPTATKKAPADSSKLAASAEAVAKAARGNVRCPPPAAAPRGPAAPVDDVVGVRPGMPYDEAAQRVMCSHPLMVVQADSGRRFQIETYGQPVRQGLHGRIARERVQKTGKQIMAEMQDQAMARGTNRVTRDVNPGESKWYVGTIGLPGEERVTDVKREEWFAEGQLPPVESVLQALVAKYGEPSWQRGGQGKVELQWLHTPDGRRVDPGDRQAQGCGLHPAPEVGVQLNTGCGVAVAAHVHAPRDNPALAQFIQVGVVDQAGGYALLKRTETALQAAEHQRREQQVQDAARNAKGPTL